tara:strand:+ start:450 stop:557 length:108 start_codon:yes stop_codon:yes gene_type:complete
MKAGHGKFFTIEDVKEKLAGNGLYSGGNNAYKQNN